MNLLCVTIIGDEFVIFADVSLTIMDTDTFVYAMQK